MNYKLFILTPIIVLLIILSGCIHLLSTAEREACLSATHFSTNSIDSCETQKECYNKIINNYEISNKLPLSIYNNNITYLNNIASASFNFNQSTKYIKELNKSCDTEDVNKIIKNSNDLFANLRNIFEYIDKANAESIILIKDYAIYLENEGIEEIPEEEIYSEYITINNNLNELRVDSKNENYIHQLIEESANLNIVAKDFGFTKNYISNVNYIDLTSYYLKLIEDPSGEIRVPTIVPGLNYVLGELSALEQLKNITINLQRADNYNFYIILDRFVGKNNSLYSEFSEISTKINTEINKIYETISDLETKIEDNEMYISQTNYFTYYAAKTNFREKNIGFGTYLSMLKKIDNELNINKINEFDQNTIIKEKLKDCEVIIKSAEKVNNTYLNKLIKNYKTELNLEKKEMLCNQINFEISNPDCLINLENVLNANINEFEEYREIYLNNITPEDCTNIINNINNQLEMNNKIRLLKEIIKDNSLKYTEINLKIAVNDFEKKITIIDINSEINKIKNNPNYKLYLNIDEKIEDQQKINLKLIDIAREIENEYLQENNRIELIDSNYYLVVLNLFRFELNNIEFELNDQDTDIYFHTQGIRITKNTILIERLFLNKNYFQIDYENKKEITTKLLKLGLDNTLFEITIKNQIIGITDKIYISPDKKTINGIVDEKNYLNYITEQENKILYTQDILSNTILSNKYEKITTDKYTNIIELKIKNNYTSTITGELKLIDVDESTDEYVAYILKINNREQNAYFENGGIYTIINLGKGEENIYELQTAYGLKEIISVAKDNLLEMNRLKNSYFLDLKKEATTAFSSVNNLIVDMDSKIEDLQLIFIKENKINELKIKEKDYILAENAFFILYNELLNASLSQANKIKIEKLNDEKYTNIKGNLIKLQLIEKNNNLEKEAKKIEEKNTNYNKLQELKAKISDYNINDNKLNELILNADYMNQIDLNLIEETINENLKIQVIKIDDVILYLDGFNQNTENNTIDKIKWMFEDFSLDELYAQNYFPGITTADIERYEKIQSFLDTQKLSAEISKFKQNLAEKNYEDAKNAISSETLTRIKNVISENEFINTEFTKIKTDSKNILNKYIEDNKDTHKQEIKEKITLGKEYYTNGKYLNTISTLQETKINSKTMKSNQILIVVTILFILLLLGLYYRLGKKKKKEESYQERKKRVIRHN